MFSPEQIVLVKKNWQMLRPKYAQFAELFFYYLFDSYPDLRYIFQASPYKQQQDFLKIIDRVAFKDEASAIRAISLATKRFAKIEVKEVHFHMLKGILLKSLKEAQPLGWTKELEQAWAGVYQEVVRQLFEPVS